MLKKQKRKPVSINPGILLLYGAPKVGKTTMLSQLDDCLIVDTEQGGNMLEGYFHSIDSKEELLQFYADAADGQAQGEGSMTFDWQGAWTAVIHHPLFGIGITLGAYQLVLAAFEKTRWIFLQPVLVSMLLGSDK